MENYRIQVKIWVENVPERVQFSDEEQIWMIIKNLVKNGKAEVTILERDDDCLGFPIPESITESNADWYNIGKGDFYIEDSFLLYDEEITEKNVLLNRFSEALEFSNLEIYSYYIGNDLYIRRGYIDVDWPESEEYRGMSDALSRNNIADDNDFSEPQKSEEPGVSDGQLDHMKGKRKVNSGK